MLSCALLRARQRFRRRGSLRRLSCCDRSRSRSRGRAQPIANAKVPEANGKGQGRAASARETHASIEPRTGRAAVRLRPGDWTKKPQKNLGAAHRSEQPPPPASDARARPTSSRRSLTTAGIYPHALAGEAHLAAPHRRSARRRERARPATQRNRRARVAAAPPAPPGPRGTASAPEIAPPGRAAENTKGEDHERPLQPLRDAVRR